MTKHLPKFAVRNAAIVQGFEIGFSVREIAEKFDLSFDRVKIILYDFAAKDLLSDDAFERLTKRMYVVGEHLEHRRAIARSRKAA